MCLDAGSITDEPSLVSTPRFTSNLLHPPRYWEDEADPVWATGTLQPAREPGGGSDEPRESRDAESDFLVVEVPQLFVVVAEGAPTRELLQRAVNLALHKLQDQPLEQAAIAIAGRLQGSDEAWLAQRGILLVDSDAESPRTRALKYARSFSNQLREGLKRYERFTAGVRQPEDDARIEQDKSSAPRPR